MQFQLQKQAYRMQFPGAVYYVAELDKTPTGRMIIYRDEKEIRLVDVALLAEFRGQGIGKVLLERLKTEATFDRPLNLQVLKTNLAAKRFYERHGFSIVEDADLHFSMQWRKS
jgi:ribosomal protein S18 acetylase RimI-like enzyme